MKNSAPDVEAAALLLRALANVGRLRIALRLLRGAAAVGVLERELGMRQPLLSQQLAELRDAGLIAGRREGRTVVYTLLPGGPERLVAGLAHGLGMEIPTVDGAGTVPVLPPRRQAHLGAMFATVVTAG